MKRLLLIIGVSCVVGVMPALAQEAEEEEKEPVWKGSLGLSWVATGGNTDTSSAGVDFALDREPEPWGLSFAARGNTAQDSGERTAENIFASGRALRTLGKRWEAFGGLLWSKDPFAGFDSQTVVSAGATFIAVDSEHNRLTFDGGLTHTWEDQISPAAPAPVVSTESISFAGGLLGLDWQWQIGKTSKLTQRLVLLPNFDDTDDWRLNSLTAIEAAVNDWLALRFGYDLRYRNEPIGDAESTDTTSTASVVFKF